MSPRWREQLQLCNGSSPHPKTREPPVPGRHLGQPTSAQVRQQRQMRAGVRQGLKANLQGSSGSEAKLPLSSTSLTEWLGHATNESLLPDGESLANTGISWPMQPSLLFWPHGRKPELLHHCISKGKEIKFFTAEIPVAYQCKYERNCCSPPYLLPCLLLI